VSNVNANANNVSVTTPNTDVIAGNGTQGVTAGNKDVAPGTTENTSSSKRSRSSSKPPVAKTYQLINGDFETGEFTGWTVETSGIFPVIQDDVTKDGSMYAAHMGDGAAGMSDGYECFTSISQYISIADDDTDPILYISYYVDGDDGGYDGVDININDQPIYQIQSVYTDGWKQLCLELTEFAGEIVNLSIVCWTNDSEVKVNYYIDDITLSYEDRSVGEPNNNTTEGAIELTGGLAQTHWIYPYDDIDYFSFEAEAGVLYNIETFNLFPDIPVAPDQLYLDPYFNPDYEEYCYMVTWLNILDENGDFVAGSDNGMNSELNYIENGINKSDIDMVFEESGTYFIQVVHPYGSEFGIEEAIGRYDILVSIAVPVSVTGISLDQENIYLQAGTNGTLKAIITPENATNKGVIWTSSDTGVATVNNDGIITAVSGGTAIISARTVDGDYEAHCTVTVTVEAEIADITATNGVLTVTLDAKPTTAPQAGDFTATLSVGGLEAVPIALSGFNYDGNVTVTFTFELVEKATDEENAEITLIYKGEEVGKASFIVSAEDKEQEAPVGLVGVAPTAALDDGKITGTTTDMEYKLSSDTEWIQAGEPATTGLYSGTYNVRYKAKPGFYAGEAATVIVPAYIAPQVLSVAVTPDKATVIQGHTVQLSAIVETVGGASETVEWVSSDTEGKVNVDNTGLVTVAADVTVIIEVSDFVL
jgi:uncharacterized protein YjdB